MKTDEGRKKIRRKKYRKFLRNFDYFRKTGSPRYERENQALFTMAFKQRGKNGYSKCTVISDWFSFLLSVCKFYICHIAGHSRYMYFDTVLNSIIICFYVRHNATEEIWFFWQHILSYCCKKRKSSMNQTPTADHRWLLVIQIDLAVKSCFFSARPENQSDITVHFE